VRRLFVAKIVDRPKIYSFAPNSDFSSNPNILVEVFAEAMVSKSRIG
jgi:hypothetical protein